MKIVQDILGDFRMLTDSGYTVEIIIEGHHLLWFSDLEQLLRCFQKSESTCMSIHKLSTRYETLYEFESVDTLKQEHPELFI